jgi:hypothetical protein
MALLTLLDLPPELLAVAAAHLPEDAELAVALTCRKLREAVKASEHRAARGRLSTSIASAFGSLAKLEWAATCGMPLSSKLLNHAARIGHIEQLRFLHAHGCAWEPCKDYGEDPCAGAAAGGHLHVLQWAHTNGCPWNELTCSAAAEGGHMSVLQWACAHGCPWHEGTCGGAAKGGHLAVLQWARAGGCPWDEWACIHAARSGHLAVLQWARANGCPWDGRLCVYARIRGMSLTRSDHEAVRKALDWAVANGCPKWLEDW